MTSRFVSEQAILQPIGDNLIDDLALGICEVVSVEAYDELPYVFELEAGERLSFSLTSSHEVDLVLCDECAYDEWVDSGLRSQHPPSAMLTLRHAANHSLMFRTPKALTLIAVIINLESLAVHSAVSARTIASTGFMSR